MKKHIVMAIMLLAVSGTAWCQQYAWVTRPSAPAGLTGGEDEKDPAYKTYSEGYALILADKWQDAIKKFDEVRSRFPNSKLIDGAAYWRAYALKRVDRGKGIAAYKSFLKEHSGSRYVADAIADMDQNIIVVGENGKNMRISVTPAGKAFSFGTTEEASERALKDAQRRMRDAQRELTRTNIRAPRAPRIGGSLFGSRDLDPQTQLKSEAIRALAKSPTDKEAFATLKDIALDNTQPEPLRGAAVKALAEFPASDVFPVLSEIARNDASDEVQTMALYSIADLSSDGNRATDMLIALFEGYPKQKEKQQQTALYAIAEIGNDKAVDFLAKVATTNENYELRSDAVYYLGSIGNDKSRKALTRILKAK